MYIKKDFLALTADELTDYTARDFKLCYVDTCEKLDLRDDNGERSAIGLRLMFTPIDLKEQWGDDWNDAPYDCNATSPCRLSTVPRYLSTMATTRHSPQRLLIREPAPGCSLPTSANLSMLAPPLSMCLSA